jgi:hypothetical protein
MVGACRTYGERRSVCTVLLGKPEGNSSLGRPRRREEDNNKIDLQAMGMDGTVLGQDRDRLWAVINAVINLRVP